MGSVSVNGPRETYFVDALRIQGGREISAILKLKIIYVIRKQNVLTTFFLILIFNELFKFKISDERQY